VSSAAAPGLAGQSSSPDGPAGPGRAGLRDLRLLGRQVKYEQLTFWLNPVGAIFTVGFSLVFLIMLGLISGSSRVNTAGLHDIKLIQFYVPGFAAYGVMSACFNTLAMVLVNRRETGLLKRLRLSPLPSWMLLGAIFISTLLVAFIQVVILLAVGRLAFGVQLPGNLAPLVVALVVGGLSFAAMGAAMSTLIPNPDAAGPVTSIVFFVLLFLAGMWFPLQPGSALAKFSAYLPIRRFIYAMLAPFDAVKGASPWAWFDLLVIAIWGVAAVAIAIWRFSWSPHRN
jgi:ABC-2 type transport system permease protein